MCTFIEHRAHTVSLTFFPRYNISTEENVADIMNEVDIDRRFKKLQCDWNVEHTLLIYSMTMRS